MKTSTLFSTLAVAFATMQGVYAAAVPATEAAEVVADSNDSPVGIDSVPGLGHCFKGAKQDSCHFDVPLNGRTSCNCVRRCTNNYNPCHLNTHVDQCYCF